MAKTAFKQNNKPINQMDCKQMYARTNAFDEPLFSLISTFNLLMIFACIIVVISDVSNAQSFLVVKTNF